MNFKICSCVFLLILFAFSTAFADGELDFTFRASAYGSNTIGNMYVMRKQADGKVLVGGIFTELGGVAAGGLGRLNADGTVDETFNPPMFGFGGGLGGRVNAIAVQSDGKIIVGGQINGFDELPTNGPYRLNPDGSLDTSFQRIVSGPINDIIALSNGQILVTGSLIVNSTSRGLIRLNSDGSLDSSFGNFRS